MRRLSPSLLSLAILAAFSAPALAQVKVDGVIDPVEWQGARHITDFRSVQPLTREAAPHRTEAWVLATEDGLAVAFRNLQAPGVPRMRQRGQRDNTGPVDRVNVYVDFDGEGRSGYNVTVSMAGSINDTTIANENQFNTDWDGDWRYATSEDEQGWTAEILLPWHIATMDAGEGDKRTIGISLDRVVGATNERMAWPAVTWTEQQFLSKLERIEIPKYSQSLLAVTPYVVGLYDNVGGGSDFDAGADLFWKPSGQFQLSATLNPDFGQVESDQLVVNFGAVESFFSDKRPFFTENQAFFDVPFGGLNNANRLLYTRRVGGNADDGSGAGDVTAAVKLNGSAAGFSYGVFAATEGEDAGRDFYAARVTREFGAHGIGAMVTRAERPFLDRQANVYEMDHRWSSNGLSIRSTVVGSQVEQAGTTRRDSGAQLRIDHDIGNGWRQQFYGLHLGDQLELNDFGFLERNNFNYGRYELARRITEFPESSPYRSHEIRGAVSRRVNDDGLTIANAWAVSRFSERKDGGNQFLDLAGWTAGHDDLITRGNGPVRKPAQLFAFTERFRPRQEGGRWDLYGNIRYSADGLEGTDGGALQAYVESTFHVNDSLRVFAGLEGSHNSDWLLWRGGTLLGSYRNDLAFLNGGMTWLIADKQELRVRLEAIGLDARARQAWRVQPDGSTVAVDDPLQDFQLRNLGFQVRYRYELAPLSHLYVAYVRGGSLFEEGMGLSGSVAQALGDSFDLRDSEQLLVKLAYRFEI